MIVDWRVAGIELSLMVGFFRLIMLSIRFNSKEFSWSIIRCFSMVALFLVAEACPYLFGSLLSTEGFMFNSFYARHFYSCA
jgi:hypothetical protein